MMQVAVATAPENISATCLTCGLEVSYREPGLDPNHHITCGPNATFTEPDGAGDPFNQAMGRDITEVITWGYDASPRSQQVMIGPSELGTPCDRKIAYRVAGIPAVNMRMDPWPAIVGTAVHRWLEEAVQKFQATAGATRWLTETEVQIDDLVVGHCDLFDLETSTVWDLKTVGSDRLKKYRELGPPEEYRVQVHLYGLGMARAGHRVKRVGLLMVPRSGWLSGLWVWSEPYNPALAHDALARMYRIAEQALELAGDSRPYQLLAVKAHPSQLCSFCEYYTPDPGGGPGCPGK